MAEEVEVVDVLDSDAVGVDNELADGDDVVGSLAEDVDLGEELKEEGEGEGEGDGDGDGNLGLPPRVLVVFPLRLSYSANKLVEVPVTTSDNGAQVSSLTDAGYEIVDCITDSALGFIESRTPDLTCGVCRRFDCPAKCTRKVSLS